MALLEGEVREPADAGIYLDRSDLKSAAALDLLLETQVWRRFASVDAKTAGWAGELRIATVEPFALKAMQRGRRDIEVIVGTLNGKVDFVVAAETGTFADKVTRPLSIKPFGFPIEVAQGGMVGPGDGSGRYPIYFCCIGSDLDLLRYLLEKGGDKDLARGPFSMLVSVCDHGQAVPEMIPILIKAGIDPNENKGQYTALISALRLDPKIRKPELVRAYVKSLIENNADVNLKDKREKLTPLTWAKNRGDQVIIEMLEKAGAKE